MPTNNISRSELEMQGQHLALYIEVMSKAQDVALPAIQQMVSEIPKVVVETQTMGPSSTTSHNFIRMART